MQVELLEIRDFLAAQSPFDQLPEETLDQLPSWLTIRYLRRGSVFPPEDEVQPSVYLFRQGAIELRNHQGELFEKLAEGDLYAHACDEKKQSLAFSGTTTEDCLIYQLSCEYFNRLCHEHADFNAHFNASLRNRLQGVLKQFQSNQQNASMHDVEIRHLLQREPVTVTPETRIIVAAQLMSQQQVSALLIMQDEKLAGMITDRDLRSRCIAQGVNTDNPVSSIMSSNIITIEQSDASSDALLVMTRHNIHHLPVMRFGKVVGVISSSDIVRQQSTSAIHLIRQVHKATSLDELKPISEKIPELQRQLISSNSSSYRLGQVLSSFADALTRKLVEIAETQLGEPPVNYAWIAIGSLARQELSAHSDQDNALILSNDYDSTKHAEYFSQFARLINDGLDACGFYYCPGEVMASNARWRQPLKTWQRYFANWIQNPDHMELMLACNFFDMRCIAGDESLLNELYPDVVHMSRDNQIFLTHLAANAVRHQPPLGFFRQFVLVHDGEHDNHLDLKGTALMPITELARLFTLAAGSTTVNTYERLQMAREYRQLSHETVANLHDALEFINMVRLRHQVRQHTHGFPMNNFVDPEELSQLERGYLKDAFSIIRDLQRTIAQRYQTERIA